MPDLDLTTPVERGPDLTLVNDPSSIDEWDQARAELLALRSSPRSISATRLRQDASGNEVRVSEDTKPASPDQEERPWSTGRSATALGRAVHAVLQHADLATGADIPELAGKHAVAEGAPGNVDEVSELAAATIQTSVMRRAAESSSAIREAYIAATVSPDSPIIEGYVDLMFVDADEGLVVIDYKTDRVGERETLEDHATEYVVQLGAYAHALQAAGHTVSEAWLVFSRRAANGLPAEYRVPDLPAAMEMARRTTRRAVDA
jgi:ATP-dependent exoDNAse (exonuclease V) beta subunit